MVREIAAPETSVPPSDTEEGQVGGSQVFLISRPQTKDINRGARNARCTYAIVTGHMTRVSFASNDNKIREDGSFETDPSVRSSNLNTRTFVDELT